MSYRDFKRDSKYSKLEFIENVAPELIRRFGIKAITPAESSGNEMFEMMDMQSGIDYFLIDCGRSGKVQTLASRVRWFETWKQARQYNEITIRTWRPSLEPTEWPKISGAIKNGDPYPTYYCNAYFQGDKSRGDNKLARICTARTKQLYELTEIDLAKKHPLMTTKEQTNTDGTKFFGVNMDMYERAKNNTLYDTSEAQKKLETLLFKDGMLTDGN